MEPAERIRMKNEPCRVGDVSLVRRLIGEGSYEQALALLRSMVAPAQDFSLQANAARLVSKIPASALGKPIRVALLGSSTLDQFSDLLKLWLAFEGFAAEIWIASFDTMHAQVLDKESELYRFQPDIIWLFNTHRDVRMEVAPGDASGVEAAVAAAVAGRLSLWTALKANCSAAILDNNADIPVSDVLGNFAGQVAWSRRNMLRRFNLELAAAAPSGVTIVDFEHLSSEYGKRGWVDRRYWYHSKHAINFDAQGAIAFAGARTIGAMKGLAKKCIVLDLDNTLWGGVIGDDGIEGIRLGVGADGEAYVDIQLWARSLKERGIILAVCSKNEHDIAKEAFERHPDMQLKFDDIAVFRANWENKADNIRYIAETLNIGLDALVFVDDNPVERNLVRQNLPMVAVPELPEDPAEYLPAIEAELYFETVSFSQEDRERSGFYRGNADRATQMATFTDQGEYLTSLNQAAEAGDLDRVNLARMAQLVNKSNQFNLTTIRYSESDLIHLAAETGSRVRYYRLMDRYGDNGLISVVVLKKIGEEVLEVDLWVMSCRVLARTMEEFIFNDIVETARTLGCRVVVGRFRPTAKNKLVVALYERLGLAKVSESAEETVWQLALDDDLAARRTYVTAAHVKKGELADA
jgi:FkbH-like protein